MTPKSTDEGVDKGLLGPSTVVDSPGEALWISAAVQDTGYSGRYTETGELGAGGMGEVRLCHDQRIGRDVAVKLLRSEQQAEAHAVQRFLREARVQGQLEHPAIVPVHDLGRTPEGRLYFTMKRVRGRTLAEIIAGLAQGRPDIVAAYSRRKLLTAFASVCLAVELAHSRNVLHRDLKPANIMLGDFGEVYLLDWGIARISGAPADAPREQALQAASGDVMPTTAGQILGTPGYMAPEQVRGEIESLDPRTDVFALGVILFELCALTPLYDPAREAMAILVATLHGTDARPSARAPDRAIPPELDALCVKATMLRQQDRFATARELADGVERFLDGDRDLELRKQMADEHATAAEALAAEALGPGGGVGPRRRALAEVGRALGLDPTHPRGRRTMVSLLTTPPSDVPPDAFHALEASSAAMQRLVAGMGVFSYLAWLIVAPVGFLMGVDSPPLFAIFVAAQGLALATSVWAARAKAGGGVPMAAATIAPLVATLATCPIFGPLVLLPATMAATMAAILLHPRLRARAAVVAASFLVVAGPLALEAFGVVSASYRFEDGVMSILPRMVRFPTAPTLLTLAFASLGTILTLSVAVSRIRDELTKAERRLQLQAWQLRQLVPEDLPPP